MNPMQGSKIVSVVLCEFWVAGQRLLMSLSSQSVSDGLQETLYKLLSNAEKCLQIFPQSVSPVPDLKIIPGSSFLYVTILQSGQENKPLQVGL